MFRFNMRQTKTTKMDRRNKTTKSKFNPIVSEEKSIFGRAFGNHLFWIQKTHLLNRNWVIWNKMSLPKNGRGIHKIAPKKNKLIT